MEKLLKLFQKYRTGVVILAVVLLVSAVGLPVYLGRPNPGSTTAPSQSQTTAAPGQSQATATSSQSQVTTPGQTPTTAPGQTQATTPSQTQATTPGQTQATTPGQTQATTPGQTQATTPGQTQATTPGQTQATTPTATPTTTPTTPTTTPTTTTPTTTTPTTTTPTTTATVQNGKQISAGDKILVTVTAASVSDMYGYQFQVNYDASQFEYAGGLTSKVDAISTIFAKSFNGYQMIGATMVGSKPGISGSNIVVCVMEFKALKNCVLTDSMLGLSKASVVASDLKYTENVSGWSRKIDKA